MEHLEMVIGRQGKDLGSTQTEAAPVCSSSKAFLPSWNSQHAAPWAIQPTASGSLQSITALWQQALSGISLTALYQTAVSLVIATLEVPSGDIWEVLSDSHTVRQSVKVENPDSQADTADNPGFDSDLDTDSLEPCNSEISTINLSFNLLQAIDQPIIIHQQSLNQQKKEAVKGTFVGFPLQSTADIASSITLAIPGQAVPIGFLEVRTTEYRNFTAEEIHFLQTVVHILAIAIERKRSEELLHTQTQVLEKIASGVALPEIFTHLCLLLEQQSPGSICSIMQMDLTTHQLRSGAAPSLPEAYSQAVDGLEIGEAMASCGTAACQNESIFVIDTAQDPRWGNFQELAQQYQIHACWSAPFCAKTGEVLGTFAIAHSVPCQPTPHHLQILETATYLAAIAVERYQAAEQLKQQALFDALTGLPNRVLFMEQLKQRLQDIQLRRSNQEMEDGSDEFAVLFLDVDHFKLVNDSLGHNIGDQLLIEIVRLIKRCIRAKDTFARLGGDEFAILLDSIEDVTQAQLIADRIRAVLSFPLRLSENEVFTSVSIGIAHSSNDYNQPDELLRDADTAMYRAKASGRAHYAVFDKEMHTHALSRLHMEMDLRHVVEDLFLSQTSQLQLYYQPIVCLSDGHILGFEALLRWIHPERGFISPAEFIPVAEETGLIVPIGRWVLHEACHQLSRWREELAMGPDLLMSVNVSSRQLLQIDFTSQVNQILKSTQIPTSCIKLEITETVLMETAACVTDQLSQMQDLGIRLSLDDFGTGYSSLNYLYRFPINTLKVDRSFVDGLGSGQDQIVQTIISLAHGLGMDVTAEGVETPEQLAQLKALGCEMGQGYFFSPPVNRDKAQQLLLEPQKWRSLFA